MAISIGIANCVGCMAHRVTDNNSYLLLDDGSKIALDNGSVLIFK